MDYTQSVGKNIRKVRNEKRLSQQALAEKCGFSNTTLSSYENAKKIPGLVTIATIAKNLGVSIERLYYGDENNSFISSVPDDGRKIVNALYFLWEKRVVFFSDQGQHLMGINMMFGNENTDTAVILSRHITPVLRLLKSLNEFSMKKDTYADPNAYLEMLLSSVAAEINKEIAAEEHRAEQAENIRKMAR